MCGITGFIDYTGTSDVSILKRMRDTLAHRGPDNKGAVIVNNNRCQIGLGHRRLSIIDLSESGKQPMLDETGNYVIVFNGEVYNFNEIKKELQVLGVAFLSASDTEVVLKAYIQWGIKAVEKFLGMFAFVIYDKLNNEVFFCRDRTGVKPLYYSLQSDIILFGSELKALMAHPSFKKNIDFNSLALFLRHGWIAAPHTIFQSTYKLKPGHYLEINLSNQHVTEFCYWDVHDYYNKENLDISFDEAREQLHELLKSACEYRMVADTEVGVFLSGGFDSSTVAAILQKNRTKKINTFSIGFEDEQFNEAPYAKAVANHVGTNHHEVICTAADALELIPDLPYYYDEPFADSSAIPTMLVSKLASTTVKVALSADGGDEIFGGYSRYYHNLGDFNKVNAIPHFLRKPLADLLWFPINLTSSRNPQYHVRLQKLKRVLSQQKQTEIFRFRSEPFNYSDKEIKQLVIKKDINLSRKTFYDDIRGLNALDPAMVMMALEYKTTLVDDVLVKVDRATMAYSLEGREPFLDHRLVEFSSRFNSDYHYRNKNTKSLLREICYEYIPQRLMDRPKKGFAVPTNKWLNNELKGLVMDFSNDDYIKKQGIFDIKSCKKMVDNYYEGFDKNGERIWFFLMFQMWYHKWID